MNAFTKACWVILLGTCILYKPEKKEPKPIEHKAEVENTRGYDFIKQDGSFIPDYSDEDIRQLRDDNPNLIIKHKYRNIKSHDELIEDYIEENHEEIIERYRD